ncbi:MAG TPA: hypothetical protein PKL92_06290 [Aquaticitalea sp.]|nr:hypothetical protein [Aquaticitalea sp.]HNU59253.1 hypothetical protein [Aquaticitalea sp.]
MIRIVSLLCFLTAFSVNAQVDDSSATIAIPAEDSTDVAPVSPLDLPEIKPSLTNKTDNYSGIPVKNRVTLKPSEKEFSMMEENTLMNPGEIFEKRLTKKKESEIKKEYMVDQYFGDYKIGGEFANIICRDHEYPDGDRVRILVNDEVVIADLTLTENFKSFNVPLQTGINKITFLALNQGESGPNTAEFHVYDDKKTLVSAKRWNLLTGVKAEIVLIKE